MSALRDRADIPLRPGECLRMTRNGCPLCASVCQLHLRRGWDIFSLGIRNAFRTHLAIIKGLHRYNGVSTMKIVVIGGSGLIGTKTVVILRQQGHDVVAASPKSGINTITGEGLKEAMACAQVAVDLANSPSFEDKAVL